MRARTPGLMLAAVLAAAAAQAAESPFAVRAELAIEGAQAVHSSQPALARVEARLAGSYQAGGCAATVALRWRTDEHLGSQRRNEGELREGAVECRRDAWLMKLGRQVVVWGKADNLRVLDAVHPFDYREFLLDEKEASRRPLAMLKLECQMGEEDSLQVLLIGERRADLLPRPGDRFSALFPQAALEQLAAPGHAGGAQFGARWEHTGQKLGYTLNALHRYAPQERYTFLPQGMGVQREPYRQPMLGGSVDLALAAWVVRGEAIYTPRAYLPSDLPGAGAPAGAPPAYRRYRQLAWVAGVDRSVGEFFLSAQLYETRSQGGQSEPLTGPVQRLMSISASRAFLQDQVKAKLFAARDLRQDGNWYSATLDSEIAPGLAFSTAVDIFSGRAASAFGAVRGQSRVKFGLRLRR